MLPYFVTKRHGASDHAPSLTGTGDPLGKYVQRTPIQCGITELHAVAWPDMIRYMVEPRLNRSRF